MLSNGPLLSIVCCFFIVQCKLHRAESYIVNETPGYGALHAGQEAAAVQLPRCQNP